MPEVKTRPMTVVRLDPKLHKMLKVEAAKRGISMVALAEAALRAEMGRRSSS